MPDFMSKVVQEAWWNILAILTQGNVGDGDPINVVSYHVYPFTCID